MNKEPQDVWMSFEKSLNSLPVPYRTAFEMFISSISPITSKDNLSSISNKTLSDAKKEYCKTHKFFWKDLLDFAKKNPEFKDIKIEKDDLKRYMRRPVKDGIYLDLFANFLKLDKSYILDGIELHTQYDNITGKDLSYFVFHYEETAEQFFKGQTDIKSLFLSLDGRTQKALIRLVKAISVLL